MGIVVIGSVFVDIKGYPLSAYIPGGRNSGRVEQTHGGVCRNVAEDIANVELRPTFVSLVDDSGTSTDVIEKLNNHRVNTRYIRRTPDGLGTWLAIFDNDGDVVASISRRPDLTPIGEILDEYGEELAAGADSLVVEFDMGPDIVKKVFALAARYQKKVYAVISNMSIAMERRDLIRQCDCFVCNIQEAGLLFSQDYANATPEQMMSILPAKLLQTQIPQMVVTMGADGAVFASLKGECGIVPAMRVEVKDTTGAGDAFFAGTAIGLTYGKTLRQACEIGTRLAASVICTTESVCPRFMPSEFGIEAPKEDA